MTDIGTARGKELVRMVDALRAIHHGLWLGVVVIGYMARLGSHYALHLQSFIDVVLSGQHIPVDFILDESTNAPLKSLISAMMVVRGYGASQSSMSLIYLNSLMNSG